MKKLGIVVLITALAFFVACGDGGDTEVRDVKYYDTLEKAKNKLDWCSKKLNISLDYEKVKELEKDTETRGLSFAEAVNTLKEQIYKANKNGDREVLDTINRKNCIKAVEAYVDMFFKANKND